MVALLRGVNVGGRNKVPMALLRELVEELGYRGVSTHLQSGNVVFSAAGATPAQTASAIEAAIERRLGLSTAVLARTAAELAAVVEDNPLSKLASNPSRQLVVFLSAPVDRVRLADIDPSAFEPDRFVAREREIHVWAPHGVSETKLTYAFWEKRLGGVIATARNWNTVMRLCEMAQADQLPRR
jgi:uncharacterized protein (DUF1697 family)